uniref:Hydroxylysine kinase n=1 Tax=Romanomermis culicivorax TaxID=13658 RepID=A0A915J3Y9_ROMCU
MLTAADLDLVNFSQIPELPIKIVENLGEKLYNMKIDDLQILKGYEDKNYWLKPCCTENRFRWNKHGYVLKITNERNSQIEGFIEAQVHLLKHLVDLGLRCPEPLPDVNGNLCSLQILNYDVDSREHVAQNHRHFVSLLVYIPGKMLSEISIEEKHMRQVGMLLARFHEGSKSFRHPFYSQPKETMWSLHSVHMVRSYLQHLPNGDKIQLVDFVIEKFLNKLAHAKQRYLIPQGIIHSDFNTNNLLVNDTGDGSYDVEAFLDVGDSHYGYLIFDLAVAVSYVLLETTDQSILYVGNCVISEYQKIRPLVDEEKSTVFWSVCARLCQSLTYGYHAWTINPTEGNIYVLQTQKNGWNVLNNLLAIGEEKIEKEWFN